MDRPTLLLLIRKYLEGAASPEERAFIESWSLDKNPNRSFESILNDPEIEQLKREMFNNIRTRLQLSDTPNAVPVQQRPRVPLFPVDAPAPAATASAHRLTPVRRLVRYVAVAASVLVIVFGTWLLYHRYKATNPEYLTVYAERGKIQKLILSDGSQVWLNADSKIRFAKDFGSNGSRELFLEGEAYFEVAKDQQHPFLVHTQTLTTHVLGTRFNVKAYAGMPAIEVTLLEGKVMLSAATQAPEIKGDTLYLSPNERAVFTYQHLQRSDLAQADPGIRDSLHAVTHAGSGIRKTPGKLIRESITDAEAAIAWREGVLVFNHTALNTVIEALNRKYNIRIHADSSLLDQSVSITMAPADSAENALFEITRQLKRMPGHLHGLGSKSVQYRREGSEYFFE